MGKLSLHRKLLTEIRATETAINVKGKQDNTRLNMDNITHRQDSIRETKAGNASIVDGN